MAIRNLSLKSIREQIEAGTREVTFQADDGSLSQMVYIPKFTVPAGLWANGTFPPTDLHLGGFFIDKYQASHKAATSQSRGIGTNPTVAPNSEDDVAVSLPGRVPWTNISWHNAKQACRNRKINGVSCQLVTARQWAAMAYLIKLLGHDIRGSNSSGRDLRDPNEHAFRGVDDPTQAGRVLTGTGPVSWSHNGTAAGVFDLVGNVHEWIDFTWEGGIHTYERTALTSEPVAQGAGSVDITAVSDVEGWDATADRIIFNPGEENEESYPVNAIVPLGNGVYDVSFAGAVAAEGGFPVGTSIVLEKRYCLIPGGSSAYLAAAVDDSQLEFVVRDRVDAPGSNGFEPGDIIQMDTEQVIVASVNGNTITVEGRGANGSTPKSHPEGMVIAKLSPQGGNYDPTSTGEHGAHQYGYIQSLRLEPDLAPLAIPATVGSSSQTEWMDRYYWRNYRARAAHRGGDWGHGAYARAAFALSLSYAPAYTDSYGGFRAALLLP